MSLGSRRAFVCLLSAAAYAPLGLAADRPAAAAAGAHEFVCGEALTVWRKARDPGARDCCALVVVARAGLWTTPARTRDLAARASALCPSGLEAALLGASALLAAGDALAAHRAFERALADENKESFSKLPAGQRLLAARAASLAGERGRALEHYRSTILDLDQIASPHERARVLLEATVLAARATPPQVLEAHAYLRQSSEHLSPRLQAVRRLVARAVGFGGVGSDGGGPGSVGSGGTDSARGSSAAELAREQADGIEVVAWMQERARLPLAAPGGLLPVLPPDLLAEILPREFLPAEQQVQEPPPAEGEGEP